MKHAIIYILRRLFYCDHRIKHEENLYGDVITAYDCRSIFRCQKCGKIFRSDYLHHLDKVYAEVGEDLTK